MELNSGTLYDLNKMAVQSEEPMTNKELLFKLNTVQKFFQSGMYFMLLCHERRDYTVFRISKNNFANKATQELKECLLNRGVIVSIDKTEDNYAFEIWMKIDNEAYCYYLFPYDEAIIEV